MRRALGQIMLRAGTALLLTSPTLAQAETRQALVIADRALAQEIGQPSRDALAVSRALLAAGFDVRRLENPSVLPDVPSETPDVMLIYLSADLAQQDGRQMVMLSSGPIDLAELAERYPAKSQRIVLAESCAAQPVPAAEKPEAGMPDAIELQGAALISQSPGAALGCDSAPRLTTVLLSALEQPGGELADNLTTAGLPVSTGPDWSGFHAIAAQQPARASASGGTLILDQPLRPVNPMVALATTSRPGMVSAAAHSVGGGVQILPAAAVAPPLGGDRQSRPTQSGLPEPSIIVGVRPRDDAPTGENPDANLQGTAVGTSFEERQRIRQDDPDLFASLLDSGAFDPATDQMANVIQAELQRMNCYTAQVDGIWGNGSRAAVDRYAQQIGAPAAAREPVTELFRQIALRDDARCPDIVTQPVRRNPQPVTSSRRRPQPVAQPSQRPTVQAPQPPAPPAAPAQPSGGLNPNIVGTGMFR